MRTIPFLLVLAGCATSGSEPYAGWRETVVEEGGYSVRYLEPPWELDGTVPPPGLRLEVPFQHSGPPGLPAPPPAYIFVATPGPQAPTDALAANMEATLATRGDVIQVPTRPFSTRSGLQGHEVLSLDSVPRWHRETFVTMPAAGVVHMSLESNDDAGDRDVDDMLESLEAVP